MSRASTLLQHLKLAHGERPASPNRRMRRAILRPWRFGRRSDRWGRVTTQTFRGHRRPASYTIRSWNR